MNKTITKSLIFKSFIILFVTLSSSKASLSMDEDISLNINALFKSNLIVIAKIIPTENQYYQIELESILKKSPGIKLVVGDRITVRVSGWGTFGKKQYHNYDTSFILYLHPYESYWWTIGQEQHIKPIINNKIPFRVCNQVFMLSKRQFIQMKFDFYNCFNQISEYEYKVKRTLEKYNLSANPLEVVKAFYDCYKRPYAPHVR